MTLRILNSWIVPSSHNALWEPNRLSPYPPPSRIAILLSFFGDFKHTNCTSHLNWHHSSSHPFQVYICPPAEILVITWHCNSDVDEGTCNGVPVTVILQGFIGQCFKWQNIIQSEYLIVFFYSNPFEAFPILNFVLFSWLKEGWVNLLLLSNQSLPLSLLFVFLWSLMMMLSIFLLLCCWCKNRSSSCCLSAFCVLVAPL